MTSPSISVSESLNNSYNITNIVTISLYHKYFGYFIGIVGVFLLIQFLIRKYRLNIDATENRYYLDQTELVPKTNYFLYPKNTINYLYWNGDFNSTYQLYDLLINKGLPVQTIYIKNDTITQNLELQN